VLIQTALLQLYFPFIVLLTLVKRKLTKAPIAVLQNQICNLVYYSFNNFTIMKKLLLSALALVGFASLSIAQTAAKTAAPAAKPKMEAVKKETAKPATSAKVVSMPAAKTAATPAAAPLKKDGTPDKRFKANKEAAPAAGPMKKDGTPDKRFKANKKG
jgi:hypothetical protein